MASSDDKILLRLSGVKFSLHRFLMRRLCISADAMTSDIPFRVSFVERMDRACPDMPGREQAREEILKGIFGSLAMLHVSLGEGLISAGEFSTLRTALWFCNGNRPIHGETVTMPDGSAYVFSEADLVRWESILGISA